MSNTATYNSKFINANFRIKVSGIDNENNKIHSLVGVSGIVKLIGWDLLNKFITRALRDGEDVCVCKLRRGLKVSLYVK